MSKKLDRVVKKESFSYIKGKKVPVKKISKVKSEPKKES